VTRGETSNYERRTSKELTMLEGPSLVSFAVPASFDVRRS
jgi:hypothetical protein